MFKLLVVLLSLGVKKSGAAKLMILGLIGTTFIGMMKLGARRTNFNLYRSPRSRH